MAESGNVAGRPRRSFYKAFRPLFTWLVISMALLLVYYHKRLSSGTTVIFTVAVSGETAKWTYSARLNGLNYRPGERTSIGSKKLRIEGLGLEPMERKHFVWYGTNDLGEITLQPQKGELDIKTIPSAQEVRVTGPRGEISTPSGTMSNPGLLVGDYRVTANFGTFEEQRDVQVRWNETSSLEMRATAGILQLTTEPPGADFVLDRQGKLTKRVEGRTPSVFLLPVGNYTLNVWIGDYRRGVPVEIRAGETNALEVRFEYGSVSIASEPPGATIYQGSHEAGQTPRIFEGLKPGDYRFRIEKAGHLPAEFKVAVLGKTSTALSTNLVNRQYAAGMERARSYFSGAYVNHRGALAGVEDALQAKPADSAALELKARIELAIKNQAEQAAKEKATNELRRTTQNQLNRPTQTNEKDQVGGEDARTTKIAAAKALFNRMTGSDKDAALFDIYEWSFPGSLEGMGTAILRTFGELSARWKLQSHRKISSETYLFQAAGGLPPNDDPSHCTVLASQVAPNEVVVLSKFSEYSPNTKLGLKLLLADSASSWIPIHPDYYQTNKVGAAELRRQTRAGSFKTTLQRQLR